MAVDVDRPGHARCPGRPSRGQRDLRAHAQPEDDEVGRRSCRRRCAPPRATPSASTSISRTGWSVCTVDAHVAHGRADPLAHVGVQLAHRQRIGEDDGDVQPAGRAAPRPSPGRCSRPPRTTARLRRPAAIAARMAAPSASRCTPYTPGGVQARDRRAQRAARRWRRAACRSRRCARRSLVTVPASRSIASARVAVCTVDVRAPRTRAGVRAISVVAVGDLAADPVRDAAGGVRDVRALLEDDDLQVARGPQPARLRGRRHPGGVPADDDQPVRAPVTAPACTATRRRQLSAGRLRPPRGRHGRARNTLPGLSRPSGSSASLIARCTSSADRADLALQPVDLEAAHPVLAGDRAAEGQPQLAGCRRRRRRPASAGRRRWGRSTIVGCMLPSPAWPTTPMTRSRARAIASQPSRNAAIRDRGTATSSISVRAQPLQRRQRHPPGGQQQVALGGVVGGVHEVAPASAAQLGEDLDLRRARPRPRRRTGPPAGRARRGPGRPSAGRRPRGCRCCP